MIAENSQPCSNSPPSLADSPFKPARKPVAAIAINPPADQSTSQPQSSHHPQSSQPHHPSGPAVRPKGRSKGSRKEVVEVRRGQVMKLYLEGWLQEEIAVNLRVSVSTIKHDIKISLAQYREERLTNSQQIFEDELRKLDLRERQALHGFERSQRDKVVKTVKRIVDGKVVAEEVSTREGEIDSATPGPAERIEETTVTEPQPGNPSFLNTALKCQEMRCKLHGFDKPKQVTITDENGQAITPATSGDILGLRGAIESLKGMDSKSLEHLAKAGRILDGHAVANDSPSLPANASVTHSQGSETYAARSTG